MDTKDFRAFPDSTFFLAATTTNQRRALVGRGNVLKISNEGSVHITFNVGGSGVEAGGYFHFDNGQDTYFYTSSPIDNIEGAVGDFSILFDLQQHMVMGSKSTQNFLCNTSWSTNTNGMYIYIADSTSTDFGRIYWIFITASAGTGTVETDPNTFPNDNLRHKVAATLSGNSMTLYLDGDVVGTQTATSLPSTADFALRFGNSLRSFEGDMRRITVWNEAKSWADMVAYSSTDMVADYRADGDYVDSVGSSDGTNAGVIIKPADATIQPNSFVYVPLDNRGPALDASHISVRTLSSTADIRVEQGVLI